MQEIRLEKNDQGNLVGRIYVDNRRTSAFIELCGETEHLFTDEQLRELNSETF